MPFIIFLIFILIIGYFIATNAGLKIRFISRRNIIIIVSVLLVFMILISSIRIVQPGYVGVQILFGNLNKKVLKNGLHFVFPFVQVVMMDVRTQDYTMSVAKEEGIRKGDDAITSLTKDGLTISLDISVWYKLDPQKAADVYQNIGINYVEKIVRPAIRTSIRNATVLYNVSEIFSEKREELSKKIFDELYTNLYEKGIICDKILLRNIDLPMKVKNAIDEKIAAEQESQKMVYILEKEKKEKERKLIEAEGIAKAQRKISESLNRQYLQWFYIQNLKELLNTQNSKIIILPFDKNLVPLLNLGE
ncbi:MAG: Band 7 protein [candidate division TA06 bacterium 32_111]|uniref:Band 7 protein n=2 Tax=Bacteria candidate phyla TaxID=1783234 RepID=A0A117M6X6_UNCT6|nr:MAG: Band 7 protein [candidate division TA06 bacterium 32_111]KUK87657.1 MAG: Band 7 protein [candidate division TA06 bacterium 34_109]HAF07496.1 band 7 protein [candidate division WOR-3 bacterium]HCP17565.1 band 7 protein [candidate division WOR-3 bacterium]